MIDGEDDEDDECAVALHCLVRAPRGVCVYICGVNLRRSGRGDHLFSTLEVFKGSQLRDGV